MNNQWQNKLRDRMERHEESAPEGLWDRIEQIMSAEGVGNSASSKRNITPLWSLRIVGAAAAALVLFFIGLRILNLENSEDIQVVEKVQNEKVQNEYVAKERNLETVKLLPPKRESKLVTISAIEVPHQIIEQQQQQKESHTPDEVLKKDSVSNDKPETGMEKRTETIVQLTAQNSQSKPAKWQTGVYASNISLGAASNHGGYGSFNTYEFPSVEEEYVISAIRSELPEGTSILNEYQHVYTNVEHHQPITIGVTFKYNLDERWSLTSGLVHSILSSKLQSGADNHYYKSHQTLHYVGLPLSVNYAIWQNDKVLTYISGGGMVEKNVSGKLSTDYVIDNQIEAQTSKKISVKPLQWSVNSTVGIQYQLYKNIGVYVEPGVAYHFNNNSHVETIYKEKPLNFNINMGLRFTLNE